jgi:cytosine deaminase
MLIDAVVGARVAEREETARLRIAEGRIAEVVADSGDVTGEGRILSCDGRVVVPAFVDAHVHLDKAFLNGRVAASEATLPAAIRAVAASRGAIPAAVVESNAERAVRLLVRHGVTAARAHVEIDPRVGLDLLRMHLALAEAFGDRISLELAAFPQRGLELPTMTELMAQAMREGATVVGGCPYVDADPRAHVDFLFALAEKHGAPLDFHLDFTDDPARSLLPLVADRTRAHGMGGRVTLGHVTTLAAMSPETQARELDRLAEAGIALVVLPATDLYLAGHGEPGTRSLAPFERARAAGVRVAVANNNVQNPFAPFGNGNLLQAAWLAGVARRAADERMRRWLFEAVTTEPAAVLGLPPHGTAPGAGAHLAVLDAEAFADVITMAPAVVATLRAGRLVHAAAAPAVRAPVA